MCWEGHEVRGIHIHFWWNCKFVQSLPNTMWWLLWKMGIDLPQNPAMGIIPKGLFIVSQKLLHNHVYFCYIHNTEMETTCSSLNQQIYKEIVVPLPNEVLAI